MERGTPELDILFGDIIDTGEGGIRTIRFRAAATVAGLLDRLGHVPLPPYIHTPLGDRSRYQTVYARERGSVAAPTAGLHFTPRLQDQIEAMGVRFAYVTLHIGLDTFQPISEDAPEQHAIHSEYCRVTPEVAARVNAARAASGRVIAVGTTAVRTLESAAGDDGMLQPHDGWTRHYILPGYRFRIVDAMITNFHLPRSTLLCLVSAFAGRDHILAAYHEAVRKHYRFYSFGDAMFIR